MPANLISHAHHRSISDTLSFTGATFKSCLTSTNVAKGAARMVFTDDNLNKFLVWTKSVSLGFTLILLGIGLTAVLLLLFTYAPMMNRFLHTAPIDAFAWLRFLSVATAAFLLVETEKKIRCAR
jgi:hypothetical protein